MNWSRNSLLRMRNFSSPEKESPGLASQQSLGRSTSGRYPISFCILRILLYVAITAAVLHLIHYGTQQIDPESFFAENGVIEWLQLGILVSCAILLGVASIQMHELHRGLYFLALFPLIISIRELDNILDVHVFDGAWQIIVSCLVLYAVFFAWVHYQALKQQLFKILSFPSTGLLISGFVTVMVFSRLFGQQVFWQSALQDNYLRLVGRIVEESCESFGYLLLLFGCIEILLIVISSQLNSDAKTD